MLMVKEDGNLSAASRKELVFFPNNLAVWDARVAIMWSKQICEHKATVGLTVALSYLIVFLEEWGRKISAELAASSRPEYDVNFYQTVEPNIFVLTFFEILRFILVVDMCYSMGCLLTLPSLSLFLPTSYHWLPPLLDETSRMFVIQPLWLGLLLAVLVVTSGNLATFPVIVRVLAKRTSEEVRNVVIYVIFAVAIYVDASKESEWELDAYILMGAQAHALMLPSSGVGAPFPESSNYHFCNVVDQIQRHDD
ncbi:hypothetical protein Ancab_008303 [Ancistrocladus abbreviatus]